MRTIVLTPSRSRSGAGCSPHDRPRPRHVALAAIVSITAIAGTAGITALAAAVALTAVVTLTAAVAHAAQASPTPTPAPAPAATPPLSQWHHTAWTARDGLSGRLQAIAQTTDGFLWIGTTAGLFRFDGAQFEQVGMDDGGAPRIAVSALKAVPDGGLWIGYHNGGATLRHADGRATHFRGDQGLPFGTVRTLARTDDGTVWLAAVGGLSRFAEGRWHRVRDDWKYPCRAANALFVDRAGVLWAGGESPNRLMMLPKGARAFELAVDGVAASSIDQAPDGALIVIDRAALRVKTIQPRARPDGGRDIREIADFSGTAVVLDPDGSAWVSGFGISRLTLPAGETWTTSSAAPSAPVVERLSQDAGLSGSIGRDVFIDREGNIWVATDAGLDRLRRRNLSFTQRRADSLPASLVTGPGTDIWTLPTRGPIRRVQDGLPIRGTPDGAVWGLPTGGETILIGSENRLWTWRDEVFSPVAPPSEVSAASDRFHVLAATVDRGGRLWASVNGFGQFRRDGETWQFVPVIPDRPDLTALAAHTDDRGRVWLAYPDTLALIDGGYTRLFPASAIGVGTLRAIAGRAGRLWIGGETGLAVFRDNGGDHNDRFVALRPRADATPIGSVAGLVATEKHGLWLNAANRIVHLPAPEIDRVLRDPTHPVSIDTFDLISDLPEPLQDHHVGRTVIEARDGALWFVTQHHAARLDPGRLRRNTLPPPIVIRALTADDRTHPANERTHVQVPALTRSIRIDYTALSLTIPERVRFRYRLDGWDEEWHDVGQRRMAFYTDLRPGAYTFRVRASNNDGVWNETGASLAFTVAPAWYQTTWFHALTAVSIAGVLLLAYRLRVRRLTAELTVRFDERLAERTRVARELHDTLVQTIQGSRMVASYAVAHTNDAEGMRKALERLSTWLDQAVQEARAALNALRSSALEPNDLVEAFRRAAAGIDTQTPPALSVTTTGHERALHPIVQDDILAIGQEAIRNACLHARATRLTVEIEYGRDFVLSVTDNGIGIAPPLLDSGRPGHFGLAGMRERAANIHASLSMTSADGGTAVRLVVPGRVAFLAH